MSQKQATGKQAPIAGIYVRVSTKQQIEGTSIENQLEECKRAAEKAGFIVSDEHIYNDSGKSGSSLDRPALTRIRQAVQRKAVDAVFFYHIDRLGRDAPDILTLVREFREAGVRIYTPAGPIEDTPVDKLLLSIQAAFAENERERITERLMQGRRRRIREGKHAARGGGAQSHPYGYMIQDGAYVPNPATAPIVQMLFQLYANEGHTARSLTALLNEQNIPPARSDKWTWGSVQAMLRNTAYKGEWHVYGEIVPIPPLVSEELWQAVRTRCVHNTWFAFRHAHYGFMLRGLVFCADCKGDTSRRDRTGIVRYHGAWGGHHPGQKNLTTSYHYRCGRYALSRSHPDVCSGYVNGKLLDDTVWELVMEFLADPAQILRQAQESEPAADNTARLETINEEIAQNAARRLRLVKLIARATAEETVEAAEKELERLDTRDALLVKERSDLAHASRDRAGLEAERAGLVKLMELHAAFIQSTPDPSPEVKRAVLEKLCVTVFVSRQKDVTVRLPGEITVTRQLRAEE